MADRSIELMLARMSEKPGEHRPFLPTTSRAPLALRCLRGPPFFPPVFPTWIRPHHIAARPRYRRHADSAHPIPPQALRPRHRGPEHAEAVDLPDTSPSPEM